MGEMEHHMIDKKSFITWLFDLTLLGFSLAWESFLLVTNAIGFAWWAKVETIEPEATYWFGPFLTENALKNNLTKFEEELSNESPSTIRKSLVRDKKFEPLTPGY